MSPQPLLPSHPSRPSPQFARAHKLRALSGLIHVNFSLTTWLLAGACLQSLLALLVKNRYYAFLPAILLLTAQSLNAILIHFNIKPNPYLEDVLLGKSTAVIPDAEGKLKSITDGQEKVAVCLLGAKSNHPFGVFAPEFVKMAKWLAEMNASFDAPDGAPNGFLGQTNWGRKDERGAIEVMLLSYWRSIEDLHAFAHAPLHRDAWTWWEKTIKAHNFIGINHEIYEAEAGHWENIYLNFQPTGLGATTYLKKGEEGKVEGGIVEDEWIGPLVDARRGKMRSSAGRLGRGVMGLDEGRPMGEVYLE